MANADVTYRFKGVGDFSDVKKELSNLQSYMGKFKLPSDITKKLQQNFDKLNTEVENFQNKASSEITTKGDLSSFKKSGQQIIKIYSNIQDIISKIDDDTLRKAFQVDTGPLVKVSNEIKRIQKQLAKKTELKVDVGKDGVQNLKSLRDITNQLAKDSKANVVKGFKNLVDTGDISGAITKLGELENKANELEKLGTKNAAPFRQSVEELKTILQGLDSKEIKELSKSLSDSKEQADKLKATFEQMRATGVDKVNESAEKIAPTMREAIKEIDALKTKEQELNSNMEQVQDWIKYFFSINNVINLLQRGLQQTIDTVKELDAAMTEIAVVTDFSVGDMWDKLPEYTKQAKALGVATADLYTATGLYYQQGLDTNAAMEAGVETMKMARIAGLEAADATDAMTSAVRGFGMAVDETSTTRVNDVYSELAAISATDVEELSTSMSKTASLAHSVNMEFENTAAFLAAGIEATRESADSIGTSLKTVLARMNEIKSDPNKIVDVDGETVDANKVDAALKSVGITMLDANKQFRDADDILLELSSKWDSLSTMQQRYLYKYL